MKTLPVLRLAARSGVLLSIVIGTGRLSAQTNSRLVLTDTGTGNQAAIDGLTLSPGGFYWWKKGAPGEVGSYIATFGIKGSVSSYSVNPAGSVPYYLVNGGKFLGGAEKDGGYGYYTADLGGAQVGLFRQSLSSAVNSPPQRLAAIVGSGLVGPGAIGRSGSDLFFAPHYSNGYTAIWRVSFNAAGDYSGHGVSAEGTLTAGSPVAKMEFFNATIGGQAGTYGLCLQLNGNLWRFGPINSGSLQPMVFLTGSVGDLGVRAQDGGPGVSSLRDVIYATSKPITGGPAGRLFTINPSTGATSNFFVDPGGRQFLALGFDQNFLFLSRTGGPAGEILRNYTPYRSTFGFYRAALDTYLQAGNVQGWVAMEDVSGQNLRSDGRFLYFTRGNQIRRVGTSVPPIARDLEAFGIEAVQIVQDLNNSVRLFEGKPILVRGYVRLAANSALQPALPSATLSVLRNGVGAGIYYPDSSPVVDSTLATSLNAYRSTLTRSFNFIIPAADVQPGTMRFTMTVNGTREILETGVANPYGNNSVSTANLEVAAGRTPSLLCIPVLADGLTYTTQTDPAAFWNQIARATTQLPFPGFTVRPVNTVIGKLKPRFGIPPFVIRSFDLPEDDSSALNMVNLAQLFLSSNALQGDYHLLGMVHPGIEQFGPNQIFNGLGRRPGRSILVRMSPGQAGTNPWDAPLGGQTLSHELGHNYALKHVNQTMTMACAGTPANPASIPANPTGNYPGDQCMIGPTNNNLANAIYGWDPLTGSIIDGTTVADILSYHTTTWTSPFTLNVISGAIAPPDKKGTKSPKGLGGSVILISGVADLSEARVNLWPTQHVPAGTYPAQLVADSLAAAALPQGHDYTVRQLDAAGGLLAESALVLIAGEDGSGLRRGFVQFLAAHPDLASLQIRKGAAVLAELGTQGAAPLVTPGVPVYDPATEVLRWSWVMSDPEGEPLFSSVQFSPDDGNAWQAVELLTPNASLTLDARLLPGGTTCRFRVMVGDGFNTTIALSSPFILPNRAPQLTIIGAQDGEKLPFPAECDLRAFAMDQGDGSLPASAISWELVGPVNRVATGELLPIRDLPPGLYSALASATDSGGATGTTALTFEIRPLGLPNVPAAPVLNGELDEAAYLNATAVDFAAGGTVRVAAHLMRSGGRLYVGFGNLPFTQDAAATRPAVIGIRVDTNGSGDATPGAGDLGFFLNQDGQPHQTEGNGSTMAARAEPSGGFTCALAWGESGWTAECCLPDAVLGGADHEVRLLLTMEVPFGIAGVRTYTWPPQANPDSPASWAPVQLGVLPPAENSPPLASAGADQLVEPSEPTTIVLDGSASSDPEGQPLTYAWTQVAGPAVVLANADTALPSFQRGPVSAPTRFEFELIVNDGAADSLPSRTVVTLAPVTPPPPLRLLRPFTVHPDGSVEGYLRRSEQLDAPSAPEEEIGTDGVFAIETSLDLESWSPLLDVSPDLLGRLIFTHPDGGNDPQRFYRALRYDDGGALDPGYALQIDGFPRLASIPHAAPFNNYPLTVSAWIKTGATDALVRGIVSKYADGSFNGWSLFMYNGNLHGWYLRSTSNLVLTFSLGMDAGFVADDQWHHVAMVIDPAGGSLYVDGVDRSHVAWTGTPGPVTTTQPVQIGRYHNYPQSFAGQIDEVSVWSVGLSGYEVQDLRRLAPQGTESGLQALWRCDEGSGTLLNDSTAGNHPGTLVSAPSWVASTAPIRR